MAPNSKRHPSTGLSHTKRPKQDGETSMVAGNVMNLLPDILRLPEDTIATTFIYLQRYLLFFVASKSGLKDPLDEYTSYLACLSLASKTSDAPRTSQEIVYPAWNLKHPPSSSSKDRTPLEKPTLDILVQTLVHAELIVLRALHYDLKVSPTAFDYLPKYLSRAMDLMTGRLTDFNQLNRKDFPDYDALSNDIKAEDRIEHVLDSGMGKDCRAMIVEAYKNETLVRKSTPPALALAAIHRYFHHRGYPNPMKDLGDWIHGVSQGDDVDIGTFTMVDRMLASLESVSYGTKKAVSVFDIHY